MSRRHEDEYDIYDLTVTVRLTKQTGGYSRQTIVNVSDERTMPAADDHDAKLTLDKMIDDVRSRALDIVKLRIEFDNNVRQLERGGDTIEGTAVED